MFNAIRYVNNTAILHGGGGIMLQTRKSLSWNPDVIGFFSWPNSCSRIMALGSTQPLTEMSTRNLLGWLACKADNLTAICEPTVWKMWEPQHLTTRWAFTAWYRDSFTLSLFFIRLYTFHSEMNQFMHPSWQQAFWITWSTVWRMYSVIISSFSSNRFLHVKLHFNYP
jgi:hypothetical protein